MATEGQAKISLILELKNKMSTAITRAKEQVNSTVGDMKRRLGELKNQHIAAFGAMKDQVPGLGGALSLLTNPYAAVGAAIVAVGAAYYKCVNMALDWQKGMAEVNVTAQLSKTELKELSDQLLDIGSRNVAPLEEIPGAFNKIISAGLDTNKALGALEPTLRASKAGFTELETTAKAAVSVMNSSGEDINTVYDTLFATLNKGNATFADIAQYLPKIVPDARAAGFALGETAGAWAYLTAQGQTAERATTLMQNAVKALTTKDKINEFQKLGVAIFDSNGKMRHMTDIIDDLSKKTSGLTDLQRVDFFDKLGLDTEAASFFAVATQDAKKFKQTIDATTNSQGALERAYNDSLTPLDNWRIIINEIKKQMELLGEKALPIINNIGVKLLETINHFKELYDNSELFRDSILFLGDVIGWAFEIAFAPIKTLWELLKWIGSGFDKLATDLFGFTGGVEEMYSTIKPYLIWIKEMFGQIIEIMFKATTLDFKGAYESIKNFQIPDIKDIKVKLKTERDAEWYDRLQEKYNKRMSKLNNGGGDNDEKGGDDKLDKLNGTQDKPTDDPLKTITSGASQPKNITINIDSFVKGGINTQHTQLSSMDEGQMEQWFSNMFMRVVRNVEMNY